MRSNILEDLLSENDVIMIDTCFAMREEFPSFIDNIEVELMAYKRKITVKSVVLAELYRHMGASDTRLRNKATRAIETICMRRNIFDIDEEPLNADAILKAFADVEFIADFTRSRLKYRMALLTNDYKLGKDINELNNLESCYGKRVEVFSLNKAGNLEEYKCTGEEKNVEKNMRYEEPIQNEGKNVNDLPMIIFSSIASFAIGVLVDKYGKQVVNSFIKMVA